MESKFFCIRLDKKKAIIGALLGIVFMVLMFTQRNVHLSEDGDLGLFYLAGIPMAVMFFVVGLIRIESDRKGWQLALNLLWSFVMGLGVLFWSFGAVDTISLWAMEPLNIIRNIAVFLAIGGLIYLITLRWKLSMSLSSILLFVLAVVNGLVWQFRGKEFIFSDMVAAGTAMTVVSEYTAEITLRMVTTLAIWSLAMFSQFSIPKLAVQRKGRARLVSLAAEAVLVAFVLVSMGNMYIQTWSTRGTTGNGTYMNFLLSIEDSIVREPEGYSDEAVAELADSYAQTTQEAGPNIIVIMNESFSDLSVLGSEISANIDSLEFYHSLQENTIRGYALTPAFGGATANAEFEFLTGHNMGMLPSGGYPYQQYVYENTYALPWLLRSSGYECFATHPLMGTGWSRNRVYPLIGFEESTFIEDYPRENMVRKYVSDREMYEYVMDKMYAKEENAKLFLFGITMQNHGGYDYEGENYTKTVDLIGYKQDYPGAEQYLSLMHESDKALEYLITSLQEYPEDTVLLFFGDHLPRLENEFYEELHGGAFATLDEQVLQRTIPFMIWANYDIEEKVMERSCLSYLSVYLLETAGIELPPYYQFLRDMSEVIPAMNNQGYYSVSQGKMLPYSKAAGQELEWLQKYRTVQHNNLFDGKNRSETFFSDYLPE